MPANNDPAGPDFIRALVAKDVAANKHDGIVHTRFPPEPNGYLHIGHAKSICLNFGLADEHPQGRCNLRFDDSNPEKEDIKYVRAIKADLRWLGFDWDERLFYASDYYPQLYDCAVQLIKDGRAYVDDLDAEQIREYRGTLTQAGRDSPNRNRPPAENLELFQRMRAGEFAEGQYLLRAKIDMASPNINMRDPVIYRIRKTSHYRTGDEWCIYPMYDFTHCISDALEGITHSLCTLEFEDHRPLYDWYLEQLPLPCHPRQIEFARLNLNYTITSKRKLNELIQSGRVSGWDDPRMPTLTGMRRRGYTPEAIRDFCARIGITKNDTMIDIKVLENSVRSDLNKTSPRAFAILKPLKVVIENYPEAEIEALDAPHHPDRPELGSRRLPFTKEIYIDRDDFMEQPPKNFYRLGPGREVRLRYAYLITCTRVIKDDAGAVIELRCNYDPATRGGNAPDGRKVKGTIHWLPAADAVAVEVRLYDRLFTDPAPDDNRHQEDWKTFFNTDSIEVIKALVEPELAEARQEQRFQFERIGYFCVDAIDSKPGQPVFNRTVSLRDTWARIKQKQPA